MPEKKTDKKIGRIRSHRYAITSEGDKKSYFDLIQTSFDYHGAKITRIKNLRRKKTEYQVVDQYVRGGHIQLKHFKTMEDAKRYIDHNAPLYTTAKKTAPAGEKMLGRGAVKGYKLTPDRKRISHKK